MQRRVASCCVVLLLLAGAERSVCLGGQGRASNDGTPATKLETMSLCPRMRCKRHINRFHLSLTVSNRGAGGVRDGRGRGSCQGGGKEGRWGVQKYLKFYLGRQSRRKQNSSLPSAGTLNRGQPFVSYVVCSTEFLYLGGQSVSAPRRRKEVFII